MTCLEAALLNENHELSRELKTKDRELTALKQAVKEYLSPNHTLDMAWIQERVAELLAKKNVK